LDKRNKSKFWLRRRKQKKERSWSYERWDIQSNRYGKDRGTAREEEKGDKGSRYSCSQPTMAASTCQEKRCWHSLLVPVVNWDEVNHTRWSHCTHVPTLHLCPFLVFPWQDLTM
jgi:hypothetical protein